MVLPPVHTTPVLLMRFTTKAKPELIDFVKERFSEGGLLIVQEEKTKDGSTILGLSTTQEELEAEAEHVRLLLQTNDETQPILEYFTVSQRKQFVQRDNNRTYPTFTQPQNTDTKAKPERDSIGLFGFNDWALLVWTLMDSITVLPKGEISTNLSRMLDQDHVPYLLHTQESSLSEKGPRDLLFKTRKSRVFYRSSETESSASSLGVRSESLRHVLEENGYIDVVAPTDIPRMRDALMKKTMSWKHIFLLQWHKIRPDPDAIKEYYGEEIAFYFAWMNHFSTWLIFPGILGLITYTVRWYRNDTIDLDEFTPFYGLITFLWAILFARFWDREENRIAFRWGTFSSNGYERAKLTEVRPEFDGVLRPSPVTGLMELYYPPRLRALKYCVSALITLSMLSVAFIVMIMSLNLQGYINPSHDEERWNDKSPHPFHVRRLAVLAEKDQIFDMNHSWRCFIPVLLHVVCIITMNTNYRKVAVKLTEWENHETIHSFNNSLILKRFLFEAFDCYIALFYLAFYEHNIEKLRTELISVFNIDTFRRLALECLLPTILKKFDRKEEVEINRLTDRKKFDTPGTENENGDESGTSLAAAAKLDEYEQFDDYLEMVIELGYVTIFASAYPLASLISIVANMVEVRTDLFKITHLCRRPRSIRADGIGMWKNLIQVIIWISALTNCFIFGFTSQQLAQWMPSYYYQESTGHHRFVPGKGFVVVFVIFGLERMLLYTALFIKRVIPEIPEDVTHAIERRQYIRLKTEKELSKKLKEERRSRSEELHESLIKTASGRLKFLDDPHGEL